MRVEVYSAVMSTNTGSRIVRAADGPQSEIDADGARGLTEASLLSFEDGPGNFDVRYVRLQAGGVSSDHAHPHEQANYVLSGHARVHVDGEEHDVGPGDFVYAAGGSRHRIDNTGDEELVMLIMRGPMR